MFRPGIAEVVYYTDKGAHVENKAGGTEPAYVASRILLSMAGVKVPPLIYTQQHVTLLIIVVLL